MRNESQYGAPARYVTERENDIRFEGVEKRLDLSNEWRRALEDRETSFLPRSEFNMSHDTLGKLVDETQKLVWIGVGITVGMQFLLGIGVVIFTHITAR